jgi:hypothetical protein
MRKHTCDGKCELQSISAGLFNVYIQGRESRQIFIHQGVSAVKDIFRSSEQWRSRGFTRRSWVVYLLATENKYEDVVSYFLGLKVSIKLWNFCKRAVQILDFLSWSQGLCQLGPIA